LFSLSSQVWEKLLIDAVNKKRTMICFFIMSNLKQITADFLIAY